MKKPTWNQLDNLENYYAQRGSESGVRTCMAAKDGDVSALNACRKEIDKQQAAKKFVADFRKKEKERRELAKKAIADLEKLL